MSNTLEPALGRPDFQPRVAAKLGGNPNNRLRLTSSEAHSAVEKEEPEFDREFQLLEVPDEIRKLEEEPSHQRTSVDREPEQSGDQLPIKSVAMVVAGLGASALDQVSLACARAIAPVVATGDAVHGDTARGETGRTPIQIDTITSVPNASLASEEREGLIDVRSLASPALEEQSAHVSHFARSHHVAGPDKSVANANFANQSSIDLRSIEVVSSQTHLGAFVSTHVMSPRSQATLAALQPGEFDQRISPLAGRIDGAEIPKAYGVPDIAHRANDPRSDGTSDRSANGDGWSDDMLLAGRQEIEAEMASDANGEFETLPMSPLSASSVVTQVHIKIEQSAREIARASSLVPNAPAPIVRNIDVVLEPRSLGPMVLKLKAIAGTMEVSVLTANPAVARVLENDRNEIDKKLKSSGIELASLSVTIVPEASSAHGVTGDGEGNGLKPDSRFMYGNSGGQSSTASNGSGGQSQSRDGYQPESSAREAAQRAPATQNLRADQKPSQRSLYV